MIPHVFRAATPDDEPFIFSTWLRSHKENGDWPHRLPIPRCIHPQRCACCRFSSRRYFDEHKHVVMDLVKHAQTIVAVNPARPAQILGFVTFEPGGFLHWVDVKKVYRRNGMASNLMAAAGFRFTDKVVCSHWSIGADNLTAKFPLLYDPFILGAPKE
jgi:hypothetical protein